MTLLHRLFALGVVVLLVSPLAAAPALAQPLTPAGGSSPPTPTPVSTSTPANGTAAPNGSAGGGGGGLFGFPTPVELADWAVSGLIEEGTAAATGTVDYVTTLISGLPAPGTLSDLSTLVNPENGLWPGTYAAWEYSLALSMIVLGFATVAAFRHPSMAQKRSGLKVCALSWGMAVGTFIVVAPALHAVAAVSLAIAPDSTDFFEGIGGIVKLGAGVVLGIILAYFATGVVVAGLVVLAAQFFSIHAAVALWPVAWALIALGGAWRSIGATVVYVFVTVLVLNILQSLVLRLLFEIPWANSPVGPVMGPLFLVVGLLFALVYLPKEALQQAWQAAGVRHGIEAAENLAPDNAHDARQQVSGSVGKIREWRSAGDADAGPSTSVGGVPSAGSPGVSSAASVRSRRAGSFGNSSSSASAGEADSTDSGDDGWSPSVDPNHGYQ